MSVVCCGSAGTVIWTLLAGWWLWTQSQGQPFLVPPAALKAWGGASGNCAKPIKRRSSPGQAGMRESSFHEVKAPADLLTVWCPPDLQHVLILLSQRNPGLHQKRGDSRERLSLSLPFVKPHLKCFLETRRFCLLLFFFFLLCYIVSLSGYLIRSLTGGFFYYFYFHFLFFFIFILRWILYNQSGIFSVLFDRTVISKHWDKLSWNCSQLVVEGGYSSKWIACYYTSFDKSDLAKYCLHLIF